MCGTADHESSPPARPVAYRTPNAPAFPLSPTVPSISGTSRRSSRSQVHNSALSIPLQQLSRPLPSNTVTFRADAERVPIREDILEAVQAITICLNGTNIKYAIVGGAGLMVLQSPRATDDVDFVVYPPSQVRTAKSELQKDIRFKIDPKTRHTTFTASSGAVVEVEALSSPGTFRACFDNSTELIIEKGGIPILNAPLYLESKCGAILGRSTQQKKETDAQDIRFILTFMINSSIRTRHSEVPSATAEFIAGFEHLYPGSIQLFHQVGLA